VLKIPLAPVGVLMFLFVFDFWCLLFMSPDILWGEMFGVA